MGHNRGRETWETTCVLCNAQAACGFSCSASKRSSFFQSVMWGLRPAKTDENRPEPSDTPQWLERRDWFDNGEAEAVKVCDPERAW